MIYVYIYIYMNILYFIRICQCFSCIHSLYSCSATHNTYLSLPLPLLSKRNKNSKLSCTISSANLNKQIYSAFDTPTLQHFLPKSFPHFSRVFQKIFRDGDTSIFQKFRFFNIFCFSLNLVIREIFEHGRF